MSVYPQKVEVGRREEERGWWEERQTDYFGFLWLGKFMEGQCQARSLSKNEYTVCRERIFYRFFT